MLFKSTVIVGFLSDSTFELVGKGIEKGEILSFPKGMIKKVTLHDPDLYKKLFIEFIAKLGIKHQKVLIVLGDSILFQEKIPLTDKVQDEANDFFKKIPLDEEDLVKLSLSNDKEVFLFGTNRQLYELIAEAFMAIDWKITGVVPHSLFLSEDDTLSPKEASTILEKKSIVDASDFLTKNPIEIREVTVSTQDDKDEIEEQEEEEKETKTKKGKKEDDTDGKDKKENKKDETEEIVEDKKEMSFPLDKKRSSKKKYILLFLLSLFITAGIFSLFTFGIVSLPSNNQPEVNTVDLSKTPTQIPTPTIVPLAKDTLTIQVQNGTGVAGQAGSVKSALEEAGFTSVETGNASDEDNTDTTVSFAPTVSQEDRDEIIALLKESFQNVVTKELSEDGDYTVVVVTGQALE